MKHVVLHRTILFVLLLSAGLFGLSPEHCLHVHNMEDLSCVDTHHEENPLNCCDTCTDGEHCKNCAFHETHQQPLITVSSIPTFEISVHTHTEAGIIPVSILKMPPLFRSISSEAKCAKEFASTRKLKTVRLLC
ncbi:hypothetical protein [Chitinivibrio alkaliphilus]|uniref:Uncharacterized protein n=1 Tax=Chitinivibrio alkaliphilus ACht1 TaxID=1313304 RepID=U7DAG2_9BACT|nr:hypothetical protein [Chitinivibrio alkaliphilus]ERP31380.1 hypothetical protein CALK_1727 [Chitinivibrio alkaliphilus ACht1]